MTARIAVSPLTGRIHRGRVNSSGTAFVGQKQDVTSDVLRAVLEKAEFHGGTFEIEGGGGKWSVAVTKSDAERPDVAERLADALFVLGMVDKNNRIDEGEKGKAWSGRFVRDEVRRVLAGTAAPAAAQAAKPNL